MKFRSEIRLDEDFFRNLFEENQYNAAACLADALLAFFDCRPERRSIRIADLKKYIQKYDLYDDLKETLDGTVK